MSLMMIYLLSSIQTFITYALLFSNVRSKTTSPSSLYAPTSYCYFFYRPKIDAKQVKELEDIQRFYMVTSTEKNGKPPSENIHRLFLLGQKQLPEIVEGKSTSKERNWALNILTSSNPEDIRKELMPAEYTTETRGERRIEAATPAGEGKY